MLAEVIELQQRAVSELYEKLAVKDEITFRAPTGSGKTYMMADLMNRVLEQSEDTVFLVSSLSKGSLAEQNYDKFCEYSINGNFPCIKPHLISSEVSGEERLYIPTDYNVYILPRDLYKKKSKLMQGVMEAFLLNITLDRVFGGCGKKIYLIKDECHIATSNLDNLSSKHFKKVINFSATPKPSQTIDVKITDEEAVNAKLIKQVEWGDAEDTVADAVKKFEEIKKGYRNQLGVNPCLIIQISNESEADRELNNVIFPVLNQAEHQDLKWMLIVGDEKECRTNDALEKIPVSKWKEYAKGDIAVDIIIFKMVISEGWDIPRACMLYQIRDSKSEQLKEQVIGRVRRNPRLIDFDSLSEDAKTLAMKAWVWGIEPEDKKRTYQVKLWDEPEDIQSQIKLKVTKLKALQQKAGFSIEAYLDAQPDISSFGNIFDLYRKLKRADKSIVDMCYAYSNTVSKWWDFAEHLDGIIKENTQYVCDYAQSMETVKTEGGQEMEVSFPVSSLYSDNGNYINISDWIWCRKDGQTKFAFDSEAERSWASILKDLASDDTLEIDSKRVAERIVVGKRNPRAGETNLFGEVQLERFNPSSKYLWGKNYLSNSTIKYEYCLDGVHSSYPDFIMKDSFGRIHIFEVKSVNIANATPASFDSLSYKLKVEELKGCYKQASILTGHKFYLPVLKDDIWHITCLNDGVESTMTEEQFKIFVKTAPQV